METPEYEDLIDEDENEEPSATPLWKYATKISAQSSAKAPPRYVSPNYEKVRTTLLDREYNKVKKNFKPLMDDWDIYGLSMISDGFSNCKNQSFINVMAASEGKAMFLSAHDCSSIGRSGLNIAEILLKEIESIGPKKVVQVVTDNAANCKLAGSIERGNSPGYFGPDAYLTR
ncbi:hypothetical protein RJ639_042823 [Escallonia herrerae]|uniref:DUF659 domain-containing protein n=1 Tax=Escallonia herrerae TaxID=1293975 RepID=A0AA88WG34_9ASTE|nr:hypothetical protein RJ639_042823 [Escallonia herrerae]